MHTKTTLLNETEAAIHLGITKELLFAYVRNAPKKHKGENRKLISKVINGINFFEKQELDNFDLYLKKPWSNLSNQRPPIPTYIKEYLKVEVNGRCPITGDGYPLEDAHIIPYSESLNHHHHNIIRISSNVHSKTDNGVISKDLLLQTKNELIDSLKKRMISSTFETKIITYLPTIDTEAVYGRKDEIEQIHNILAYKGKSTIVNGSGGIGKTSLVQLYSNLHYKDYDYFIWIEFADISPSLTSRDAFISGIANNFLLLEFLGIALDNRIPLENLFELVLKKITQLPGKKLCVFDNVPNAIVEFSYLIPDNREFNILGTSRTIIDDFTNITVDVLDQDDATNLFYSFYSLEKNDQLIHKILASVGFHTLAIELVSKLATKRILLLEVLYQTLSKDGINMSLEARVTSRHDKKRIPTLPFNYLCNIFDLSNLNYEQIALLRNLTVIGSISLSFEQLESLLNDEPNDNKLFHVLSDLNQAGWITNLNGRFYIHQLICDVLRFKLKPTYELCAALVKKVYSFIEKSSNKFSIHVQKPYIQIAEQIINLFPITKKKLLGFEFFVARYYGFSGNFEKYNNWYLNNIRNFDSDLKRFVLLNHGNILLSHGRCQDAVEIFDHCKILFDDQLILAQINGGIAHAYSDLGNFSKANELFKLAYDTIVKNPDISKSELAIFLNNYTKALNGVEDHRHALKISLEVLVLRESFLDRNHPLLAQSYNNIGVDYEYLGQLDKALSFHTKALNIRKEFGDKDNVDLSESYHNLASIYIQSNELSKAKDYFEKALEIRESAYPNGSPTLILTYCCLAASMININSSEAISLYKKALNYYEAYDLENNQYTPVWLMGYTIALIEIRDYRQALTQIDLSIRLLKKQGNTKLINPAISFRNQILGKLSPPIARKIGRNDLCPCGSGRKHKKCCGKLEQENFI